MPAFLKDKAVWIPLLAVLVLVVALSFFRGGDSDEDVEVTPFTNVIVAAQGKTVEGIVVHPRYVDVHLTDGGVQRAYIGPQTDVVAALQAEGVPVGAGADRVAVQFSKPATSGNAFWLINLAVPLIFIVVAYWAIRIGVRHGFEAYERRRNEPRP